jgi:signal transduction histidine kinase
MAAAVAVALAAAAALARAQARRLAEPVGALARQADALGRGERVAAEPMSGIPEVDLVASSLVGSSERIAELLTRERAFSADVSHQLRTPLTGLRLRLERLATSADSAEVLGALREVDRLHATIDHLLALAREQQGPTPTLVLGDLLDSLGERWAERLRASGRRLRIERRDAAGIARGSTVSISQVLDVLVDNALRHGAGTVTVRSRQAAGAHIIEVEDEGSGIPEHRRSDLFARRNEAGHGLGLALGRALTEADGGRLLLAGTVPATFHVVLGDAAEDEVAAPTTSASP